MPWIERNDLIYQNAKVAADQTTSRGKKKIFTQLSVPKDEECVDAAYDVERALFDSRPVKHMHAFIHERLPPCHPRCVDDGAVDGEL